MGDFAFADATWWGHPRSRRAVWLNAHAVAGSTHVPAGRWFTLSRIGRLRDKPT